MSAWKVYSKNGSVERCELKSLEYGGTAMGERAVTATFRHHSEVAFEIFDYIEYRGEKFELEAVPTVKKVSSFEYIYELRFVSLKYELERCEMRDLVPYDNELVYPTPLTFSFTGDVRYLTERIQACLDNLYGEGIWNIIIADGVESEEKNITISQQNCWNALALVNSTYGLSFYIKGRTITIGGEQPLVGHIFEYGKGNGLYEIERASDTDTGIVTKLRAYGSTRNLDYSYPKRPEWSDSALPVSFAFSPLRLMLPSFKTDGKTDYVLADSATIAKYGIREASMVYDDIYPTIAGATYNGQSIDEIKSVEAVDDNAQTFVVHLHDLGFDLEEHLTNADAQISMKTGAMQGYTFTMSVIEKQEDGSYKITLGRISAEGGDNYNIPNSDWNMKAGDKFVLLNILMPQKYIRDAENRLQARAEEYLAQYSRTNFSYNIGLHDKFLMENPSVYESLIEGSKLKVYDKELGVNEEVTIQSITITENAEDNILPQVKVTLNNEPSASTLERIQGRIDALANETAAGNFATQSEIMAQYRKKLDKPYFDKLFVAIDKKGNEIASNDITTPVAYIKAKYDFAVVGGVTMYATDKDLDIPSIYDGLLIDNDTIYWEEIKDEEGNVISKRLKARGGSGEGGITPTLLGDLTNVGSWANAVATEDRIMVQRKDSSSWTPLNLSDIGIGYADFSNVLFSGNGNAFTSFSLSEDKKTLTFNKEKTFAEKSNSLSGYGITDAKISNGVITLGSNTITPLTSHQTIYNLTLQAGAFSAAIFDPNGAAKTVNIPTTTSHISEGSNLYFTNARAVSALSDTLKAYVTLSGTQTITGEKDFTGGLKVNGSQIVYDKTNKYWKLTGDLVVTGGITMFANDGTYTPPTITDAVNIDNQTIIRQNGVLMINPDIVFGGGGGGEVSSVAWANIFGKPTTISGYGITDAKISNGTITLGESTLTPITQASADERYLTKNGTAASATKLTTVSKKAWGVTYWTDGGVPTDVSGSMTGVGSITMNGELSGATKLDVSIPITKIGDFVLGSLHSVSNLSIRYSNAFGVYGMVDYNSGAFALQAAYQTTPTALDILLQPRGGNVAIGKTSATCALDVNGAIKGSIGSFSGNVSMGSATVNGGNLYYDSSEKYWKLEGDLLVTGGITMYGVDGSSFGTIWDNAPIATTSVKGIASFDSNYFAVNNGKVTFIGSTGGGGIESITKQMVIDALGYTPYNSTNPNGYITSAGSITGNAATSTKVHVTSVANTGPFPIIYTDISSIGSNGYRSLYCTSKSGTGYNPVNDTFVAAYFKGSLTGNADTATTASKLSTTSKTAWGQTYWTSGGVPTSIDGNMSNVGHITMKGNNSYDIGTSSVGVRYIYANWIGAISGGRLSIGANDGTAITILTDQKVGIGTKNPFTALQVDQSEWANGITINRTVSGGGGAIAVRSNGTHIGNFGINGSKQLEFNVMSGSTAQVKMTVDSSGNGLFYGGVTMYSDIRKKTILNHVELSLKEVADAPLIEHYYNSDEAKTTHVGSVAQYWAGLNDWFCKEDGDGFLTMEIQNAALASAISVARELTRYESKTDKQIKKLRKRIGELEEEIENLKNK
jgi:hypothetical protein